MFTLTIAGTEGKTTWRENDYNQSDIRKTAITDITFLDTEGRANIVIGTTKDAEGNTIDIVAYLVFGAGNEAHICRFGESSDDVMNVVTTINNLRDAIREDIASRSIAGHVDVDLNFWSIPQNKKVDIEIYLKPKPGRTFDGSTDSIDTKYIFEAQNGATIVEF